MGSGKGGRSRTSTVTNRVDIPDFLRPFVEQQARIGGDALSQVRRLTNEGDFVAGFNPDQQQSFDLARMFATGQDGFLPTAQSTFMGAAQGMPTQRFVDPAAYQALSGMAGGQGFLPTMTADTLNRLQAGGSVPGVTIDALTGAVTNNAVPQQTLDTLNSTARGDFLFGGSGFDAAVEAAMRAAQPGILSTFGRGGAGAATGGLAQAAIGKAAADAFALQHGQERQNQLGAANALGGLGLQGQQQQLNAAGMLGDLGLRTGQQQLQAAGMMGDFASQQQARQLQAAGQLSGLSDAERSRQLAAAGALPGLGAIGSDVLSRVGAQQQALQQQQMLSPLNAQLQLLSAAGGGVPLGALLGNTSTQTTPMQSSGLGNFLGTAASGLGIASAFAPEGAAGLAALGGPWGLGLSLGAGLLGGLLG